MRFAEVSGNSKRQVRSVGIALLDYCPGVAFSGKFRYFLLTFFILLQSRFLSVQAGEGRD